MVWVFGFFSDTFVSIILSTLGWSHPTLHSVISFSYFLVLKEKVKLLLKASLKCDVLLYPIVREPFQVVYILSEFIALILIIWELLLSS